MHVYMSGASTVEAVVHPMYECSPSQCAPFPLSNLGMYAPCPHKRVRLCGWLSRRGVE
jgi:hypothetical protein